jgi:hypothetical protein
LPGWQALHNEIESLGATVVTVALDIDPALAKPWNDLVNPTHPSLVDTLHITNSLFGFTNIPMPHGLTKTACWFGQPKAHQLNVVHYVTWKFPKVFPNS